MLQMRWLWLSDLQSVGGSEDTAMGDGQAGS